MCKASWMGTLAVERSFMGYQNFSSSSLKGSAIDCADFNFSPFASSSLTGFFYFVFFLFIYLNFNDEMYFNGWVHQILGNISLQISLEKNPLN